MDHKSSCSGVLVWCYKATVLPKVMQKPALFGKGDYLRVAGDFRLASAQVNRMHTSCNPSLTSGTTFCSIHRPKLAGRTVLRQIINVPSNKDCQSRAFASPSQAIILVSPDSHYAGHSALPHCRDSALRYVHVIVSPPRRFTSGMNWNI